MPNQINQVNNSCDVTEAISVVAMTTLKEGGEEDLQRYLDVVGPLMEAAGAKLISRHEAQEKLAGDEPPMFVSIVQYPSQKSVRSVFSNPDYLSLKSVIERAFTRYDVFISD